MRHIIVTLAMVAVALLVTFGVGAMLEQTAFKAGPEPSAGLPADKTPVPATRHGRGLLHSHEV
jgi:hypothetical protein